MTNATKTLGVLFIIFLVAAGFVRFSGSTSSTQALTSRIITIDTAKVNKVVIQTPDKKPVMLIKKDDKWSVRQGKGESYPANRSAIESSINRFTDLKPNAIVTRDPKKFTRYQVDSTGIKVAFMNNDTKLAGIVLGRFQMGGRRNMESYVRPAGQNIVFLVDGFLRRSFNGNLSSWRDKKIWNIPRAHVTQIDMIYPADSSYTIVGKNGDWFYGTDTLKVGLVGSILDHVARLQVDDFDTAVTPAELSSPLYSIRLHLKNGETREVHLTPGTKDNKDNFLLTATHYPYVGKVEKSLYKEEVLKPLDQLKKHPKKSSGKKK